jgi:hypothetical protein
VGPTALPVPHQKKGANEKSAAAGETRGKFLSPCFLISEKVIAR